jgi:hypothetical protein
VGEFKGWSQRVDREELRWEHGVGRLIVRPKPLVRTRRMRAHTKEKPGFWTRWRAFAQVKLGSNIQLLPHPLVTERHEST